MGVHACTCGTAQGGLARLEGCGAHVAVAVAKGRQPQPPPLRPKPTSIVNLHHIFFFLPVQPKGVPYGHSRNPCRTHAVPHTHPYAMPYPPTSMATLPATLFCVLYGRGLPRPSRRPTMSARPSPPHIMLTAIRPDGGGGGWRGARGAR